MSDPPPELTVRSRVDIRVNHTTDLVTFYRELGKNPHAQQEYWEQDLEGAEEWERPLSYLASWLDEGIWLEEPSREGGIRTMVDWDWIDFDRGWSKDRYSMLLAEVPWMVPRESVPPEELARMPGPNDVPLFDEVEERA